MSQFADKKLFYGGKKITVVINRVREAQHVQNMIRNSDRGEAPWNFYVFGLSRKHSCKRDQTSFSPQSMLMIYITFTFAENNSRSQWLSPRPNVIRTRMSYVDDEKKYSGGWDYDWYAAAQISSDTHKTLIWNRFVGDLFSSTYTFYVAITNQYMISAEAVPVSEMMFA